ncbi:hypothetical protein BDV93DRAFT_528518 [Ceratobasidium sp. AG-I]|nr:hypothetical protein BDV93DRAFT_528518 [Ceratobasidium sp. AG-I]
MRQTTKSIGLRLASAFQDATRVTASVAIDCAPIPGLQEVKKVAMRLVDTIEHLEIQKRKQIILANRITSTIALLEAHSSVDEPSLELQYFYNKMLACQTQLASHASTRGLSRAFRASQQLEMIEMLEREINADFQDAIFSLLLRRMTPPPSARDKSPTVDLFPQQKSPAPVPNYTSMPLKYPVITRCELDLTTVIRRTHRREGEDSLVRSLSTGKCRGQNVLVVQYSSKTRREDAMKAFLADMGSVVQERHPNVLQFMGGSESSDSGANYYLVFETGNTVSRETFFQTAQSSQEIFRFLTGAKSGMQCLLDHGVQTWDDILISHDGRAIVCPPYWENDCLWDKSNHDVFSSLNGTSGCPDFPLNTLTEILNISEDRWKEFETAVVSQSVRTRDYHLMQIAEELGLPVPPFLLVYYGKLPGFILSVGSFGIPDYLSTGQAGDCFHGTMTAWSPVSSLWSCTGWEALQTCSLDYWLPEYVSTPIRGISSEQKLAISNATSGVDSIQPLETSSDGWLSYGEFESGRTFGLGYELVISEPALFEQSWDRFCSTRIESLMHLVDEEQDFHAVKHVSVSICCESDELRGLFPLYFHRRPSSLFNVEHYWGFFSENPDPNVSPCRRVRDLAVNYSIEINTMRAGDSWLYRADQCLDSVMMKTPGTFEF